MVADRITEVAPDTDRILPRRLASTRAAYEVFHLDPIRVSLDKTLGSDS